MRSAMLEALTLTTESPAPDAPPKPVVRTSAEWVAYFRRNAANLLPIPWERGRAVSQRERDEVIASLRSWQIGETSDGTHMIKTAERYAAGARDPDFVEAIRLFVAEEQRHGETLGRFLDSIDVPRKTRDWGEFLFRTCRHALTRLETNASVIVMVEVHALLYYAAVRRATSSPVLRQVCNQLLRDEIPHIRFQCERLAILHRGRKPVLRAATVGAHRAFFTALTLAVWLGHRRALRAGGLTFGRFWRRAWVRMGTVWRAMDPRGYEWPAP